MIRRLISSFGPQAMPMMTRPSYRRELIGSLTMPVAVSLVEGNVIGVMAKKVFSVTDTQLAIIVAAPFFANLTSMLWAMLARGRRKVRFITGLMIAVLTIVCLISLVPITPMGAWVLAGLVVLTRCLLGKPKLQHARKNQPVQLGILSGFENHILIESIPQYPPRSRSVRSPAFRRFDIGPPKGTISDKQST